METKEIIQCPAIIEKIETRQDNTLKIIIGIQEMDLESEATLMKLRNKIGWLLFKESPLSEADILNIPEIKPDFANEKTPSQRLRSRIFVYYKETKGTDKGFNDFYTSALEKIGQSYLDKIEKDPEEKIADA